MDRERETDRQTEREREREQERKEKNRYIKKINNKRRRLPIVFQLIWFKPKNIKIEVKKWESSFQN